MKRHFPAAIGALLLLAAAAGCGDSAGDRNDGAQVAVIAGRRPASDACTSNADCGAGSECTSERSGEFTIRRCVPLASSPLPVVAPEGCATSASASPAASPGVSLSDHHSCALATVGGVECWGLNRSSELGTTPVASSASPIAVTGLEGASAVSAGGFHSCALVAGQALCWGNNGDGQLGTGRMPSEPVAVPAPVANVANASALSAGYKHTCVIVASEVRCWGDDFDAQLGAWKNIEAGVPNFFGFSAVAVDGLPTSASAIAAGGSHTCAIVAGGQVRCWGSNYSHESGATKDAVVLVTAVEGLTSAVAIAAGSGHTCAIVSGGEVRCWGANSFGGLGDGSTVDHAVPVTVAGLANATAIAAGSMHTCALTDCGRVACWGYNVAGQLGNGSTTSSARPVLVPGIVGASAIFAGADQTCVRIGSALECWGSNRNGVLGVSTTAMCGATPCSPTPVVVRP